MSLRRAASTGEYVEWVAQAVFEVADLRDCLEYEIEDMARFPAFLDPRQEGIRALDAAMPEGAYTFGREDLLFMDLAEKYAEEIPFHTLLKRINETHRRGLDSGGDEA
ncbi:MAG: general secretion pathway protein GspF [Thiocapsa sp.]|nr:general secretion pathway protein GspF [Thiocapsa sp.]MCG6896110.1 general secretion pathway protein GspF [Thiocapsa sp.]MCG6986524.1 general secretion pathway protein GspF [Thiocapsa sp.]